MGEEDEEDYGALIYRESQLRKAEAAAAAALQRRRKMPRKRRIRLLMFLRLDVVLLQLGRVLLLLVVDHL